MPIELAHGLQVMQMCEAFSQNKCEVELIVPRRINKIKQSPFLYYGINSIFSLTRLPTIDLIFLNNRSVFFLIQTVTFLLFSKLYLLFKHFDLLYSREQMAGLFFKNVVLEIHLLPKRIRPFHLYVWKRAKKLVVITSFIKNRLIEAGISEDKIIVASDGVNLALFDISMSKEEARAKLQLPNNKRILGYVGMLRTLGMEKGVDIAIKALSEIKEENIIFVLVGGSKTDIDFYKKMVGDLKLEKRVVFIGRVEHSLIPTYLKAFDILLAPFPENEHYSYYMSPMKIFEYMASGRPIVTTKLPTLSEILGDCALLVAPGSVAELRSGIMSILNNSELDKNLSKKAHSRVLTYTWEARAKQILDSLK